MSEGVRIFSSILDEMTAHSRAEAPLECCGLLAGREGKITETFPTRNALRSRFAYEIAPAELFAVFRELRARGLDLLGIYHSHPHSENAPSPTDIAGAFYPDTPYFIISLLPDTPRPVRAFQIGKGSVTELEILSE